MSYSKNKRNKVRKKANKHLQIKLNQDTQMKIDRHNEVVNEKTKKETLDSAMYKAPTIKDTVKKRGFFKRLFGK